MNPAISHSPTYSIVLPFYNQGQQIQSIVNAYCEALSEKTIGLQDTWELVVVVNGSHDDSYDRAQELARSDARVRAFNLEQGGWGRAVKYGIAQAQGAIICYTNSARTQMPDLLTMLKYAKIDETRVIKATRTIRDSLARRIGSVLYNLQNRFMHGTTAWDINGTPKVAWRAVFERVSLQSDDDLIDAEFMAKCHRQQIRVVEVPVWLTPRLGGKSTTNFKSAFKMYGGVFRLKGIV
jgi:glycosyltransferase involved in cell wall biosynthesis